MSAGTAAPGSTRSSSAKVERLGGEGFGGVAHDFFLRRTARGFDAVRPAAVEAREIQEIANEALEPARFATDHRRRALARIGIRVVECAVGQCLGIAPDRRERRAQVVRDREEERALAPARFLELRGHAVEGVPERGEVGIRAGWQVGPAPEVAGCQLTGGALDLADGSGQAAREPHRNTDREQQHHDRGEQQERSGSREHPGLDLIGRDDDEALPADEARGNREEHGVAAAAAHVVPRQELNRLEVRRGQAGRKREDRGGSHIGHRAVGGDEHRAQVGDPQPGAQIGAQPTKPGAEPARVAGGRRRERGDQRTELGRARTQVRERVLLELSSYEHVRGDVGEAQHHDGDEHHRGDESRPERTTHEVSRR